MRRGRSLLLLLMFGCGGRDPLLGVDDEGLLPPATGGATGGGSATGGTGGAPVTTPPSPGRDAGLPLPPLRDAAPPPPRVDAAPMTQPPSACAFPRCVADLVASCMPSGSCVQQRLSGGGGIGTNVCFDNGVKVFTTIQGGGRNMAVAIKVVRADGSPCYSIEPEQRGAGVTGLNYRNPSGTLVATGTVDRGRLALVCSGQTAPQVVDVSCQPGLTTSSSCRAGMCQ